MRSWILVLSCLLTAPGALCAGELKWPRTDIPVPPEIQAFITSECHRYKGSSEESVDECIYGERYGYRAVATMLTDDVIGDKAAQRYRVCAAGLGDFGGRFHRRKAECIGKSFLYVWRFEFSLRADAGDGRRFVRLDPARR